MESLQHENPQMDVTLGIAASPTFEANGICYVACRSGLYRSDDWARTLVPVFTDTDGAQVPPVTAVAVAAGSAHGEIVMAAVPGGIVQSSDGGSTWSATTLPSPDAVVSCFATSPEVASEGTVLAGTLEDGLFRSEDWGESWTPSNIGLLDTRVLSIVATHSESAGTIYFVGTTSGVATSTNGGRSWRERDGSLEMMVTSSLAASGAGNEPGLVVGGTEAQGVWRTEDAGSSWHPVAPVAQTGAVHTVLVTRSVPKGPGVLAVAEKGIMYSPDLGASWASWNETVTAEDGFLTAIAPYGLDPHKPILAGGMGGGIRSVASTLA